MAVNGWEDGIEVLRRIKQDMPQTEAIIITGHGEIETAVQALRIGAFDYITEPIDYDELALGISRALEIQRLIAERKQAEEALKASRASFYNIVEKSADGTVVTDRNGIVRFVNKTLESLLHRKAEELVGELFGFPMVGGEVTEVDIIRKGGEPGVAEMCVVQTEWEGEVAYLASLRDITERKRAEEALRELDRMKSEFISNISHELRSPLHAIRGFTKLILEGKVPDPETQKEFLTIVDEQSKQLSSLVDNLLDMSRIESGRFSIQKRPTSIKNIIQGAVESFYAIAKEKGIVITKDIPATMPQVEVDSERVKQVMVNLLSNAIKFSEDGSPIMVKVEVKDSELLVQVTDHGIGIPEAAMPHLFERFHQTETASRIGGTGLGLYISKQIIEAHGGRIWAKSKQEKSSTFSFTLPLGSNW